MPRVAHLIMAHRNPAQVGRLLDALAHPDADCYLHIDDKADLREYASLAERPGVYLAPRRFVAPWASYRLTEAIVECTRDLLATKRGYDYVNLLSGQDYPIKPPAFFHAFLDVHLGESFMSFEQEGSTWWQETRARVEHYHTANYRFKGQYKLEKIINRVLPRRRFPLPYRLFGGPYGCWWTLGAEAARYLVAFLDAHPTLQRFARFTWAPDEFLPATILLNSPLAASIRNENYRFMDWSRGGSHPKVLTVDDFDRVAQAPKMFARKFDATRDVAILDRIDAELLAPERQAERGADRLPPTTAPLPQREARRRRQPV
jgi:hypothetical protein